MGGFGPLSFACEVPMAREPKKKRESQGSRVCTSCNRVRLLSQFETFKDGNVRGVCRECVGSQKARKASASPESFLRISNVQLKSQRLKQGIQYDLTLEDLVEIWDIQAGRCALSGVLMTHQRDGKAGDGKKKEFNASIDRINPQGPYVRENVQLVANRANTMKHTLGQDMFMWWVKNIHDNLIG
jgi:hypothetical protein